MHITLTGTITEKEYINTMLRFKLLKADAIVLFCIGIVSLGVAIGNIFWGGLPPYALWAITVYLFAYYPTRLYFFYRKSYRSVNGFSKQTTYTFTTEGYNVKHDSAEATNVWTNLYQVLVERDAYFIYINNHVFFSVLKRWFTPQQKDEFEAFLKSKEGLLVEGFKQ